MVILIGISPPCLVLPVGIMPDQAAQVIPFLMRLIPFSVRHMVHVMESVIAETDTVQCRFRQGLPACGIIGVEKFIALRADLHIRVKGIFRVVFIQPSVPAGIFFPYHASFRIITILLDAPLS